MEELKMENKELKENKINMELNIQNKVIIICQI